MGAAPLLVFDRADGLLHLLGSGGATSWLAGNNADSTSRGPWPLGVFEPDALVRVGGPDGEPAGCFGPWFLRYVVPGRTGMAIHAGRRGDRDGLGREGPLHATKGCIRTSAEALEEIARLVRLAGGALPLLWVPR